MGEADSYYNPQQGNGPQQYYQPQQPYQQQQPQQGYNQNYQQPPYPPPRMNIRRRPTQTLGSTQVKIEKPKWNDWWAGVLLILFFAGFVVVSAFSLYRYSSHRNVYGTGIGNDNNTFSLDTGTIILFAFVLVVALVLGFGYLALARTFPKQFIWVTGILNIVFALGTAIFYLIRKYWSAGIVFLIFAAFMAFCFYTWISRIPFAALMLKTSVDVSRKYGHTYIVSFVGGLLAAAISAWFSVTLVAIYTAYQPSDNNPSCASGGCSQAKVIGLIAFVTFTMYWVSEWIKNTIHVIIAGIYGSWYFNPHHPAKGATRGAAKRALTYSFGSVSLGSLFLAIIQFLRMICSVARSQAAQSQAAQEGGIGGAIGYVVFCILGCIISILQWAAEFFNKYAFVHIALYGKAYFAAAKDTWKMVKDRGIDALINDCLISPVVSFGGLFVAYACALLAYLYLLFKDPPYNNEGQYTAVVLAFSFLIGMQITLIITQPLVSGINTIFVAAGWDPQVLWREHPEVYAEMCKVYPKVQQVIRDR
ncbi:plasma-membrane choline transporter-domain-containing protein [Emericellopsis atlantica]|uniref:Protein PNS1 n=1 Tax=Emericellopsis atlantica TaxID=2614577 RepID=A0A9P7ZT43_9HYPO|nr:plasma-membrane choline transporter-domain-containing protein [Emericellopsis atlantica]KAG9257195.1 plasma-membrane choline transporter-domain-containing protein [Emericellopsis atlantica]